MFGIGPENDLTENITVLYLNTREEGLCLSTKTSFMCLEATLNILITAVIQEQMG